MNYLSFGLIEKCVLLVLKSHGFHENAWYILWVVSQNCGSAAGKVVFLCVGLKFVNSEMNLNIR